MGIGIVVIPRAAAVDGVTLENVGGIIQVRHVPINLTNLHEAGSHDEAIGIMPTLTGTWSGLTPTNLENITDGNYLTACTEGIADEWSYIQVDLGSNKARHGVYIDLDLTGYDGQLFSVQVSEDGATWDTIFTTGVNGTYRREFRFPSTFRYMRLGRWNSGLIVRNFGLLLSG
jgi:hypothetical protein